MNLKSKLILTVLLSLFFLVACQPAVQQVASVELELLQEPGDRLRLNIARGTVAITFDEVEKVFISGTVNPSYRDNLIIDKQQNQLVVDFSINTPVPFQKDPKPIRLELIVPQDMHVSFETFDASLFISGQGYEVDVTSMSGDTVLESFSGSAVIKANRGDVAVNHSNGSISVFGNYGTIQFNDVQGIITAVNILGKVIYRGRPAAGDQIRLETDHGSVMFDIPSDANLEVLAQSTSGEVVCMASGLSTSPRACSGELGRPEANLLIKTVSGKVTLKIDPLLN